MKRSKNEANLESEADIQRTILDYLKLHRIFHWRNNSGAIKTGKRFIRYGCKGSPDIIALHRGQFVGIEVKGPGEDQTEDQLAFEQCVTKSGNRYIVARSLEDVERAL